MKFSAFAFETESSIMVGCHNDDIYQSGKTRVGFLRYDKESWDKTHLLSSQVKDALATRVISGQPFMLEFDKSPTEYTNNDDKPRFNFAGCTVINVIED